MGRYPVEQVRIQGSGHDGIPTVVVAIGAPQGGSTLYVTFEETDQGPRAVTEIMRDGQLQYIHIPMDYPPDGLAQEVVERGTQVRAAVARHGADAPLVIEAAQGFIDAVELFIAQVYSA